MASIWDAFTEVKSSLDAEEVTVKDNGNTEKNRKQCMRCGEGTCYKDNDEGRYLCKTCGVDNGPIVQDTAEWRYYQGDKKKNPIRCGYVLENGSPFNGAGGLVILGCGKEYYRRVHKWNQMDYKEVALMNDFTDMKKYCYKDSLPAFVLEDAKTYYRLIKTTCNKIGRAPLRRANMAVCVYFSCRLNKINRELKDIGRLFEVDNKKMSEAINDFHKCFHYLESMGVEIPGYIWEPTTSQDYIRYYGKVFEMDDDVIELCVYVANMVDMLGLIADNIPHSIGITCLNLVCSVLNVNHVNRKLLAQKCSISEVTIIKSTKRLEPFIAYLFPKELLKELHIVEQQQETIEQIKQKQDSVV